MISNRCRYLQKFCEGKERPLGCEVGVEVGNFSAELMDNIPNLNLTGVDPYVGFSVPETNQRLPEKDADFVYAMAITKYGDRQYSKLIRMRSHRVIETGIIGDNFYDFVYIDAIHTYEECLRDITLWWPKVKLNGVMGVHDFSANFPGVKKAVAAFFQEFNIIEVGEDQEHIEPSVFIIKNK